jgi:glycyl-tRNA synthetase beta chain
MSASKTLLVELRTEELPPKSLNKLGESFASLLAEGLRSRGLVEPGGSVTPYASPRRLAVSVTRVLAHAADREVEHKLMPVSVGLDAAGAATPALRKKLAAVGAAADLDVATLDRRDDGKATTLLWRTSARGATLAQGLQAALDETIAKLPIAKVMSYQLPDGWTSVAFVRPAHGLVALHGADVVSVGALGLHSGRQTLGHRFEAAVEPVVLQDANHYAQQLHTQGNVIAAFTERRAEVMRQLQQAASAAGLQPIDDAALLDEVTALVENPNVLSCSFEPEFLAVPAECLVLTMKANQKYFPLLDAKGKLTNKFLVVANVRPENPQRIVEGNQRVVRPRLADAKFFFDKDRKATLESRLPMLDKVVYHAKLGSMGDRVRRIAAIARAIGQQWQGDALAASAERAARLAKADLVTDMVGEFPELQGVMGRYYAAHDGETATVAEAIEDHYKPRFAGDALPRSDLGVVLALADKLETLAGLFFAGEVPTGDRDPFALRRSAFGVIRILIERELPLQLKTMAESAFKVVSEKLSSPSDAQYLFTCFPPSTSKGTTGVLKDKREFALAAFLDDRLATSLTEIGIPADCVASVLMSPRPPQYPRHSISLADDVLRMHAAMQAKELPSIGRLAQVAKRAQGYAIPAMSGHYQGPTPVFPAEKDVSLEVERQLIRKIGEMNVALGESYREKGYLGKIEALEEFLPICEEFFNTVLINDPDLTTRNYRYGLAVAVHGHFSSVCSLSSLSPAR